MQSALVDKFSGLKDRGGLKATDVANITGKSPATVSRWTSGQTAPHPRTQILLTELSYVVDRLSELYSPEETRLWLYARHPLLEERTPIELINEGRAEDVLNVIDQLLDGVYL